MTYESHSKKVCPSFIRTQHLRLVTIAPISLLLGSRVTRSEIQTKLYKIDFQMHSAQNGLLILKSNESIGPSIIFEYNWITVLPVKSDLRFCLQLLSKLLTCTLHLS